MRLKKGFTIREIVGETIIVAEGINQINFNKVISLNESAAYLWRELENKEFSIKDVAKLLVDKYDIDKDIADKDANNIVNKWIEIEIAEN